MKVYSGAEHVNIGSGGDLSIDELIQVVCDVVGFTGKIAHDMSKPDGTPRKLLSVDKINALGWAPLITLRKGIEDTYLSFRIDENRASNAS
jgi:GDP-L-fucose synthase